MKNLNGNTAFRSGHNSAQSIRLDEEEEAEAEEESEERQEERQMEASEPLAEAEQIAAEA